MDALSIAGAYQSVKATKDLLSAAFNAKVDADAKAKINEAQSQLAQVMESLFESQQQLFQLQHDKTELQAQLSAAKTWDSKFQQYELTSTDGKAVVYRFKGEPIHYICPSCVNNHQIHILQPANTRTGTYRCTGCSCEYRVNAATPYNPVVLR